MLFMGILTYDCEKRGEVIKRRGEKGPITGGKIIGEWAEIGGGRVFRVIELDNPKIALAASIAWNDLAKSSSSQ